MGGDPETDVSALAGVGPPTEATQNSEVDQAEPTAVSTPTGEPASTRLIPPGPWLTATAFVVVLVPFAVALAGLLAASGHRIYLPDDLALIDLHVRRALVWKQQLGVFDHYGWNHPGPTYFYLLSMAYRLLGSGARAMFVGATLLNALAAVAVVAVVRRRTGPARALWAATWVCFLAGVLVAAGPGATTYSESTLGALVSPWNPTVVIFPLLLFTVLCAAAADRSPLSLLAALVVGSFTVQTDISTFPVVATIFVVAAASCLAVTLIDRRRAGGPALVPESDRATRQVTQGRTGGRRFWWWAGAGVALFVLMWTPPVIQQLTNHPGNVTLIVRFFTSGRTGQSIAVGAWSLASVTGVLVEGPAEVMRSLLGSTPIHPFGDVTTLVSVMVIGGLVTAIGMRQKNPFATGLGALGLIGCVTTGAAVTRVTGPVFGYLVIWAVALPIAALIGLGMLHGPSRLGRNSRLRLAACVVGLVVCGITTARVTSIPPLAAVSDPEVGRLVDLVSPVVSRDGMIFVGDNGAGSGGLGGTRLLDVERFIGLVNRLDQDGYHPVVSPFWKAQFGPGYLSTGDERWVVQLATWRTTSPGLTGYRGRVGDMSVVVSTGPGYGGAGAPAT